MRTGLVFVCGVAAGALGGVLGLLLSQQLFASEKPSRVEQKPPVGASAPGATASTPPSLSGSANGNPATVRGIPALATLHAIQGDQAEFLRLAERALAGGAGIGDLLGALAEFPPDLRGKLLVALLDAHPNAAYDTAAVARMLADSGQGERALTLVRDALPRQDGFHPALVRLLLRLDPEGSADALFRMRTSEEWDGETFGVFRALLIEAGQESRLKPFLDRALDARPSDHALLRQLRRIDSAAALDRIGEVLRKNPEDPWAWVFLGEIQRDASDPAAAFDAFRKAAERNPERSTFRELMRADPVRGLDLVVAWAKDRSNDESIGTLAEMYELAGRKPDALAAYLRAHEADPDDSEWLEKIMELDPAAAVTAMERRVGNNREAATDRVVGRYGAALEAAGRAEDAYQQYLAAHRKRPSDYRWQEALARVDPAAAIGPLQAQVRVHPADASAHGALGMALAATGRRSEAAPHLERALARGDAEHWYSVLKDVDPDRALTGLRLRAEAEGRDDDLWGLLGDELRVQGLTSDARTAYQRAADIDPANRDYARALHELR